MTATSPPTPPRRNSHPRKERRITVRFVRRNPIDTKAHAKALVDTIPRELDEAAANRGNV
jgi:hypothetical protein